MANKNLVVSTRIVVNGKQAEMTVQALKNEVDRLTDSLEQMRGKLAMKDFDASKGETSETVKAEIKRLERDVKTAERLYRYAESERRGIEEVLNDISNANYNELTRTRGLLQSSIKSLDPTTEKYKQKVRELQELRDEIAKRDVDVRSEITFDRAKEVLAKPNDYSVKTINEAVAVMTKFRDIQTAGSKEWNHWNGYVQNGTKFIEEFNASVKQMKMEDLHLKLYEADPSISDNDLNTLVRYWEAMAAGADKGTKELEYYNQMLEEGRDLMQQRTVEKTAKVMAAPAAYSVDEINQAIEATKKLQAAQQPDSDAWKNYGEQIANAKNLLDQFNNEVKESAMKKQLATPRSLSPQALSEQKKYWQEMINTTDLLNPKLVEYKSNLQQVVEEEQIRAKLAAETMMSKVDSGAWKGTIGDTQEAIKQLKEYRTMLDATDAPGLKRVDEAVAALNQRLKEAEQGYMSIADALAQADKVGAGTFDGTIEDLEILKKRLEEIKTKEISIGSKKDPEKIKRIDEALFQVENRLKNVGGQAKTLDQILEDIPKASLEDLQQAAKELETQISRISAGTDDYIEKSKELRTVNKQIDRIKANFKEKESIIARVSKRLTSYVAVYGGFNFIWGQIKEAASANLSLSDSMADVQKTTAMTSKEIAGLGKSIDAMDTRTSQQELYNLAATAGQLGIRGSENILGFVKASNQITVALNELGADGTSTLMKIANLTGEITNHGVEKALLRIGSSINELTATTTATAGPMVDFIGRFGGVASVAGIATHEMAAVGATADALKQEIEVTGTAMNKVVNAVTSNTRNLAAAVNVDYKALNELVKSGKTMDAIVMVFEAMGNAGGVSAQALKELGSEGDRMNRVITSFAGNIDMLKDNLLTSATAFEQMTSIQNEYNVKNENAAALWERIRNTLMEIVTNPKFVEWLTNMLHSLKGMVEWLVRSEGAIRTLFAAFNIFLGMKLVGYLKAMSQSMKELKLTILSTRKGFTLFVGELKGLRGAIAASTGVVNTLKVAFSGLFRIMVKHPFMLVASVVAILATRLIKFKDASQEAAEAQARLAEEESKLLNTYEEERSKAEQLASKIKDLNIENDERKKLIAEFNRTYGKYLGYMLQEKATAEEVAAAYKLVNEALTNKHQLDVLNLRRGQENERFSQEQIEYINSLRTALSELGVDNSNISKAVALVNTLALQGKESAEIIREVNKQLGTDFRLTEASSWTPGANGQVQVSYITTDLGQALKDYTAGAKKYLDNVKSFTDEEQGIKDAAAKATFERQKEYLNEELDRLKQMPAKDKEQIEERKNAYRNYFNTLKGFYTNADKEQKKEFEVVLSNLKNVMSGIEGLKDLSDSFTFDAWGKVDNLKDWTTFAETINNLDKASPKSLAATLKAIEEQSQDMSEAGLRNFNEMFSTNFDTSNLEKFNNQVYNLAKQIRARLKELNRGTDANFLWDSDGSSNEAKRETRKEYQAAMSALEAYYKEREAMIREQGVKENALQSTIDKLVAKNTENLEKDRVELIKKLLGEENKFDPFANEGYKGVLTGNVFFGDTKNLDELAANIARWGLAMEDGMRNTLSASFIKVSKQAETEIQRMQKILLQDDFTEQVAQQYMESLDKLGLLFGLNEKELTDTTAEQGRQRLEAMREYADRSYSLTAEKLEEEMKQNALFDAWNIDRKREHYEVLLGELRKFHDDQIEADKKTAERRKKIADARFKASGQQGTAEGNIKDSEAKLDFAKKMNEFGVGGEQVVNELEIEVLKQKIAYEQQWLALLAQESAAKQKQLEQDIANAELLMQKENDEAKRQELNNQLNQLRQQLASEQNAFAIASADSIDRMLEYQKNAADIYSQQFTGYFDKLKDYQSNIDSFAQSMGEGIFGSKEDRQQAGRELLASVLTTSKNLIQVWLTQLATRRLVDEMEVKQTEATEMRKRAIKLQSMIQDGTIAITGLSVDAAKTEASILLSSAEAAGKEAAKKGLIGLAVGAAISAALSALLGAALGKVNQSKAEIASATGASGGGKLATGMLTYAEGNYPVLGNDGKVYNARYEGKGMKTGVYGGGAHFGIFSEKQPEAIIDGKTTQRLMLNYPEIWKSIVTLSRVGKIERGMRTFATGNIQEIAAAATTADSTATAAQNEQWAQMQATLIAMQQTQMMLIQRLNEPIQANINMYGDGGMYKSMEKAGKFAKRRGY